MLLAGAPRRLARTRRLMAIVALVMAATL